jgi:hypothetical protein
LVAANAQIEPYPLDRALQHLRHASGCPQGELIVRNAIATHLLMQHENDINAHGSGSAGLYDSRL